MIKVELSLWCPLCEEEMVGDDKMFVSLDDTVQTKTFKCSKHEVSASLIFTRENPNAT